jgi:light-regulated signal transduction histidine kinase (bacteriophytochrome)
MAKAKEQLEEQVVRRTAALRQTVADLEAFSHSLSHDMRAPLRAIRNLTRIVLEDYGASLNAEATDLLKPGR